MISEFGEGYVEALRKAWGKTVPGAADFVMFWWWSSAELLNKKGVRGFGLITTNSIHQSTNRRCVEHFLSATKANFKISYAIPDHPWVDSSNGAAVRISMTVATLSENDGALAQVVSEKQLEDGEHAVTISSTYGVISSSLRIGPAVGKSSKLKSNEKLCWQGCKLVGSRFQISSAEAMALACPSSTYLKSYWTGGDLTQKRRERFVVDFFGLSRDEAEKANQALFQHLLTNVYPERASNRDKGFREKWWLFGRSRPDLRKACASLTKYICTSEVSKHRIFTFLNWPQDLIDGSVMAVASDETNLLGVLSSSTHTLWSKITGGRMGVGNDLRYQSGVCFETFPFPDLPEGELKTRIRDLGERLDAHRKARQAAHPDLTLTGMYNVLEKLRKEEPLTEKDKTIHAQGLITLLKQIHDDLDAAVVEAYGARLAKAVSSNPQSDDSGLNEPNEGLETRAPHIPIADRLARGDEALEQAILQFLVDLNHEHAAEEARGKIRYLRPKFQDPNYGKTVEKKEQDKLALETDATPAPVIAEKLPWPKSTSDRVLTLKTLLQTLSPDPDLLSKALKGNNTPKRRNEIQDLLETLTLLGQL